MKELWKLEADLCRCCHAEGVFNNLSTPRELNGVTEIYSNMLEACFNIIIFAVPSSMPDLTYHICETCIMRLRDAYNFMKQVQECEEKFKQYYNTELIRDTNNVDLDNEDNIDDFHEIDTEELTMLPSITTEKEVKLSKKTKKLTKQKIPGEKTKTKLENTIKKEGNAVEAAAGRKLTKFKLRSEDYKHDGESFRCGHCNVRLKMACVLKHVRNKHYKIPKYSCQQCDAQFLTMAPFTVHKLEVHNIDDRFKCKACKGAFNSSVQLRKHKKNFHMLGKKYKCDICDYETYSVGGPDKHKFKHMTVKDHHCRFCKKSFVRKNNLDLHERIHTGDKRKVCKECGQAFVQKSSLNYHMTKYHPNVDF